MNTLISFAIYSTVTRSGVIASHNLSSLGTKELLKVQLIYLSGFTSGKLGERLVEMSGLGESWLAVLCEWL